MVQNNLPMLIAWFVIVAAIFLQTSRPLQPSTSITDYIQAFKGNSMTEYGQLLRDKFGHKPLNVSKPRLFPESLALYVLNFRII